MGVGLRLFLLALSLASLTPHHGGAGQTTVTANTATSTTATPDPARDGCPALSACMEHSGCSACLNSTAQFAHHVGSVLESGSLQVKFIYALNNTPECWPDVTPHHMLNSAFQELRMTFNPNPCQEAPGFTIFWCQLQEYICFVDPNCRCRHRASARCSHATARRSHTCCRLPTN